ncbi:hypothetical protein ABEF93_008535 [Exophiala dermatitidis]
MREREPPQRPPSRSRRSPLPTMPTNKQTKPNTSKPLTPALSSNFRNARTPLTPRVVGSAQSSPSLSTRREPFVRSISPGKSDQVTTPLNGNITPRSGARLSRIGTESPSTPVPVKNTNNGSLANESARKQPSQPATVQAQGLGINTPKLAAGTSTPVVTVHRRISGAKSMVESDKVVSAKFFHANDAKSTVGSPGLSESPRISPGRGHFFVGSPPLSTDSNQSSKAAATTKTNDLDDKFFRADDIAQHAPSKRPDLVRIKTAGAGSVTSISKGQTPPTGTRAIQSSPPLSPNKTQRSVAPLPPSPRGVPGARRTSPPALPRPALDRPKSATGSTTSPAAAASPGGHRKSVSSSSVATAPVRRFSGQLAQGPHSLDLRLATKDAARLPTTQLLSPATTSPRSVSLASTNTIPTSVTSEADHSEAAKPSPASVNAPESAGEQAVPPVQPQNDEAANARRERKVLDLEISNSSLLAINKTLERELRKQSGELRRYRRLSRSGRLSLAASTRTASGQSNYSLDTVTEHDDEDQFLSDMDHESDMDDLDDEEDSLLSNDSSSFTSSTARSRQRARDEKRLLLDLSKHQQLLIDSQKLSQSIKRCLTVTEELIRDGNKALDYRVGIGDVELGGRVLHDDELDERGFDTGNPEQEGAKALLSPALATSKHDDVVHPWPADHAITSATESSALALLQEITDRLETDTAAAATME